MKIEDLHESPQIVQDTEFNFTDDGFNKEKAQEFFKKKIDTVEKTDQYEIFITGDYINGNIIQLGNDGLIHYFVRYKVTPNSTIGKSVTQIALWRMKGSGINQGLTTRMFFDFILSRWEVISSDGLQTANGRDFWIRQMAIALLNRGHKVGIFNASHRTMVWCDATDTTEFNKWLQDQNAWGTEDQFKHIKFIISR